MNRNVKVVFAVLSSKLPPCGANMRVEPVDLLQVDAINRAAMAQFQAALTHGHPTALASSDLTATAIAFLIQGCTPQDLPTQLMNML